MYLCCFSGSRIRVNGPVYRGRWMNLHEALSYFRSVIPLNLSVIMMKNFFLPVLVLNGCWWRAGRSQLVPAGSGLISHVIKLSIFPAGRSRFRVFCLFQSRKYFLSQFFGRSKEENRAENQISSLEKQLNRILPLFFLPAKTSPSRHAAGLLNIPTPRPSRRFSSSTLKKKKGGKKRLLNPHFLQSDPSGLTL